MIKLSDRLLAVAELAGSGVSVVDVGTDHGFVPVWLWETGRYSDITASDINPGPLMRARETARAHGAEDKIRFILTDGLRGMEEPRQTVIIAGMGGETMAGILNACPWVGEGVRLVLQPQSKLPELSVWLDGHGFVCQNARIAADAGRLYTVFSAERGEGGFDLMGRLLRSRDRLLYGYLQRERQRLTRALSGMERGAAYGKEEYLKLKDELGAVKAAIAEVEKW